MAKVEYGSTLITSTGSDILVLNDSSLVVERVVLFTADSDTEVSAGYHDASVDFTGSAKYGDENLTHTLTHYRTISGVKTKTFETTVTDLDTGEFTINTTTRTVNTRVRYVVFGS